jgi:hypothetical protein
MPAHRESPSAEKRFSSALWAGRTDADFDSQPKQKYIFLIFNTIQNYPSGNSESALYNLV